MRVTISLLLVLAAGVAVGQDKKANPPKEAPVVKPREGKTETIKLFDGKTLDGWEGYTDLWSVKDGVIVAKNTDPLKFSTYLLTKEQVHRLPAHVRGEAGRVGDALGRRLLGRGRRSRTVSKDPKKDRTKYTYAGHLVMFPSGWGMYDLFGRNGLPVDGGPAKKVGKQHDWNDIEILAQGNRVRVAVNGTAVVDWRDPEPDRIKEGPIGLQLHSNTVPQEVHFKGLVLETFPKEDKLLTVK